MKFSKLLLLVLVLNITLFTNISSVLADDNTSTVVHETDSGSTVSLEVGQKVEFSLSENIPNTTSWIPFIAWWNVVDSIEQIGAPQFDATQKPVVLNFFYSAKNPGQTMLVFYKNGLTLGIPNDIVQHPLIFMVDVK